jgi:hypothetical protein
MYEYILIFIVLIISVFLYKFHIIEDVINGGTDSYNINSIIREKNPYIPEDIRLELKTKYSDINNFIKYDLSQQGLDISLLVTSDTPKELQDVIKQRCEYLIKLHPQYLSKKLRIVYYNTNHPKKFTSSSITKNNINSGVTIFKPTYTISIVYRNEEAPRVINHELIHGLNLPMNDISGYKGLKLFEAIVDAYATYVECQFSSDPNNCYNKEVEHAHIQADKILHITGKTFKQFVATPQPTNVREYYLVKLIMLKNIKNLMPYFDSPKLRDKIIELIENYQHTTHSDSSRYYNDPSSIRTAFGS